MIVCFALLGIFMAAAATFISTISSLYYEIKGETYARQVSDIVLEKIESEIDGAIYKTGATTDNPALTGSPLKYSSITLYDKTDTQVKLVMENNELIIRYSAIRDDTVPNHSNDRGKTATTSTTFFCLPKHAAKPTGLWASMPHKP